MDVLRSFQMLVIFYSTVILLVTVNSVPDDSIASTQVCYSWWVLSSLTMIDRVHWIDKEKLVKYILDCQVTCESNEPLPVLENCMISYLCS